jgi:methylglutaconyl-CoA hydratase
MIVSKSQDMSTLKMIENEHHVVFQLNRPDKKNALNSELILELTAAFQKYSEDPHCRLIVLTGAGDAFSAGADLESMNNLQSNSYEENLEDSLQLATLFKTIIKCDKPILGKINGHAIAGGCGLLSLCDISITHPTSKFGYSETRIGFVPAMVARFLVAKIGESNARKLLLSGITIDAAQAEKIGLISEVTSDLDKSVDFWVDLLTKKVSPEALRTTKQVLRDTANMNWDDAIRHGAEVNAKSRQTSDCKKGVHAFLNKSKIDW